MRILLYHEITPDPPAEVHAVAVDHFKVQMAWLRDAGYAVAPLTDLLKGSARGKSLAITFDDGYLDTYSIAAPVLEAHGYPATVFLAAGLVGATAAWREDARAPMMSWAQARELSGVGFLFGSHTLSHCDLAVLNPEIARSELVASRRRIEDELGMPAATFSYPHSRFRRDTKLLVQEAGYALACSCPTGWVGDAGDDYYNLRRITVLSGDSLGDFTAKITAAWSRRLAWYRRVLGGWRRRLLKRVR